MNLLFWNLGKNDNTKLVVECINEHDIDVAVFAECNRLNFDYCINLLGDQYCLLTSNIEEPRIRTIIRNSFVCKSIREQSRYSIYNLIHNNRRIILAGVHLEDRRNYGSGSRMSTIRNLMSFIKEEEQSFINDDVVVLGDFNANPYDPELLQFDSFNSVIFKDLIKASENRIHEGKSYRRLYNPIINYLSEETKMYGSYYDSSEDSTPVWHSLDQVLISSSLVDLLQNIQYIKCIGSCNLISRVKPNENISDHLPLVVNISEGVHIPGRRSRLSGVA